MAAHEEQKHRTTTILRKAKRLGKAFNFRWTKAEPYGGLRAGENTIAKVKDSRVERTNNF